MHVNIYPQEIDPLAVPTKVQEKVEGWDKPCIGIQFSLRSEDDSNTIIFWLPESVISKRRVKALFMEATRLIEEAIMTI